MNMALQKNPNVRSWRRVRRMKKLNMRISHRNNNNNTVPSIPHSTNQQYGSKSASSSTFDPIINIPHSNFIAQSSYDSPPQPEPKPSFANQHELEHEHASNSFLIHLPDNFSSIVEDNPLPPPSTADDGQLEPAAGRFSSRGSDSQTIDVAVLENERNSDAKQIVPLCATTPQPSPCFLRSAYLTTRHHTNATRRSKSRRRGLACRSRCLFVRATCASPLAGTFVAEVASSLSDEIHRRLSSSHAVDREASS